MPERMPGRRFLRHLALEGPRRYLDASTLFQNRRDAQAVSSRGVQADRDATIRGRTRSWSSAGVGSDWLAALQYCDLQTYLPLDILTKVDRMTMAHSIEARPPLLDHKLVEFAATIPARFRLRDGTTKYLFKQAMRGILPDGIIDRPKHGFAVPLARWFRGELAGFARDVLLSDACRERGLFDTQACRAADRAAPARPGPRSAAVDAAVVRALVPSRARRSDPSPSTGRTRGARADPARRDGLDNCPREKDR